MSEQKGGIGIKMRGVKWDVENATTSTEITSTIPPEYVLVEKANLTL